jgi:hypothetical protein
VIGIHLDLKYHMPRKDYLLQWVKQIAAMGHNTLLIEYEDKFPWTTYPFLRDADAWTPDELRTFLATARGAGLRVIPLVQSLSHLEFALLHPQLAHLREMPDIPTQICPRHPQAVELLQTLYREVLSYHQEDEFFHLGGDETWFLGTCPQCQPWVAGLGKVKAWAEHLHRLIAFIQQQGKRPIVWDDIFWQKPETVADAALPKEVVLHAWNYAATSYTPGKFPQIEVYHRQGHQALMAPCYDWGVLVPRRTHCQDNTRALAQKMFDAQMLGMINTGWACFHLPQPTKLANIAATARICRGEPTGEAWETDWYAQEYGAPAAGVPAAMEALGILWEIPIAGYGRPVTLVPYGVMDMMAWYPGGQLQRQKVGCYPLDFSEIDFSALYAKKLDLAYREPNRDASIARCRELRAGYVSAAELLGRFARAATRQRDAAALLATLAELKLAAADLVLYQLAGEGDGATLHRRLCDLAGPLRLSLGQFVEPHGLERLISMWLLPLIAAAAAPSRAR